MMKNTVPHSRRVRRKGFLLAAVSALLFIQSVQAEDLQYTVQLGDNPWSLSQRLLKDMSYWPRLQSYNNITTPNQIPPGTRLRIPTQWMKLETAEISVLAVRGKVEAIKADGSRFLLDAGAKLQSGLRVVAGDRSAVTLGFSDKSQVRLQADTEVLLKQVDSVKGTRAESVRLELIRGSVDNQITPAASRGGRFEITTPSGVAGVRGTSFRVGYADKRMRTEVLKGAVSFGNKRGNAKLAPNQGSVIGEGEVPRPQALLAPPKLDNLPERIERLPFNLVIAKVEGAVAYRTQLTDMNSGALLASDEVSNVAQIRMLDPADGDYILTVRGIDAKGMEGRDASLPITVDARPEPPFLQQPGANKAVNDTRPTFEWTRGTGDERYHFQLATDAQFSALLMNLADSDNNRVQANQDLPPGKYYWRVAKSNKAEGKGPFSDTQVFRRPPPGPSVEPPAIDSDKITFRWRAGNPGERFRLQMAADSNFEKPLADKEIATNEIALPNPGAGTYYLRVLTIAPDNEQGPWGGTQKIDVPIEWWKPLLVVLPALL